MSETVYDARSELRRPAHFFAEAAHDLRRSPVAAWRLFRSNMQARHRRAWLGYLWLLLPTLATTLVWVFLRTRSIITTAATPMPYPVYVLAGMTLWQVFVDALTAPLQQLTAGRQMITRSRVPHEALIMAGILEVGLNCAVRMAVLAAVLIAFRVSAGGSLLLVPVGLTALAILGLAIGVAVAPAGMLYDDVGRIIAMVTPFWFFLTPVVYALPAHGVVRFNPVTPLLDTTRTWLVSSSPAGGFAAITIAATAALFLGWMLNRLARPHVIARLG